FPSSAPPPPTQGHQGTPSLTVPAGHPSPIRPDCGVERSRGESDDRAAQGSVEHAAPLIRGQVLPMAFGGSLALVTPTTFDFAGKKRQHLIPVSNLRREMEQSSRHEKGAGPRLAETREIFPQGREDATMSRLVRKVRRGFTLVEIMIVVLIMSI